MSKLQSKRQFAAAMLASGVLALALTSRAEAGDAGQYSAAGKSASSVACERARLSAWFERQRELTDGDTDPFQQIASPRECMTLAANGADGTATGKQLAARAQEKMEPQSGYASASLAGQ